MSIPGLILLTAGLSIVGFLLWKLGDPDVSDRIGARIARWGPLRPVLAIIYLSWFAIDDLIHHRWIVAAICGLAAIIVVVSYLIERRKRKLQSGRAL
jgi:hypothetical protein